jgi:hypothetical protein
MGRLFTLRGFYPGGANDDPPVTTNLILNLDAQRQTPQTDNTDVTTPFDGAAGGGSFTQATADDKPHYRTGANGINGHPAYQFGGGSPNHHWASGTFASTAGDYTVYIVADPATTGNEYFFDSLNGANRLILGNDTGDVGFYDSSWKGFAAATDAAQILTFVLESTGTQAEGYRNGSQIGVAKAYTAEEIGSASAIGARYNGLANWYEGLLGQILIYEGVHSAATRGSVESWLSSRWGISI